MKNYKKHEHQSGEAKHAWIADILSSRDLQQKVAFKLLVFEDIHFYFSQVLKFYGKNLTASRSTLEIF